jgi:hypothetical protein
MSALAMKWGGGLETDMTRHLELASVAETVPLQRLGTSAEVAQVVEVS